MHRKQNTGQFCQSSINMVAVTALVISTKFAMSSPVTTGISDLWWVYQPCIYLGHSCTLSLAIPLWVYAISTGDGFGHRWRRNSEFCISSRLCYQDYWHSGLPFASLIRSNFGWLKVQRGWAPSRWTSQSMRKKSSSSVSAMLSQQNWVSTYFRSLNAKK